MFWIRYWRSFCYGLLRLLIWFSLVWFSNHVSFFDWCCLSSVPINFQTKLTFRLNNGGVLLRSWLGFFFWFQWILWRPCFQYFFEVWHQNSCKKNARWNVALLIMQHIDLLLNSLSYPCCLESRMHTQNSACWIVTASNGRRRQRANQKIETTPYVTSNFLLSESLRISTVRGRVSNMEEKICGDTTSVPARCIDGVASNLPNSCGWGFSAGLFVHSRDIQSVSTAKNHEQTSRIVLGLVFNEVWENMQQSISCVSGFDDVTHISNPSGKSSAGQCWSSMAGLCNHTLRSFLILDIDLLGYYYPAIQVTAFTSSNF